MKFLTEKEIIHTRRIYLPMDLSASKVIHSLKRDIICDALGTAQVINELVFSIGGWYSVFPTKCEGIMT